MTDMECRSSFARALDWTLGPGARGLHPGEVALREAALAAYDDGMSPALIDFPPDVVHGPSATCVVFSDIYNRWIVCIRPHGDRGWRVRGDLSKADAHSAAMGGAVSGNG